MRINYIKKRLRISQEGRRKFFFEEPARDPMTECASRVQHLSMSRTRKDRARKRALSGPILFLPGYLFAVSPTRDRIIVSIDPSRSIALEGSSLQVFNTHRSSNRWSFE